MKKLPISKKVLEYALVSISAIKKFTVVGGGWWVGGGWVGGLLDFRVVQVQNSSSNGPGADIKIGFAPTPPHHETFIDINGY